MSTFQSGSLMHFECKSLPLTPPAGPGICNISKSARATNRIEILGREPISAQVLCFDFSFYFISTFYRLFLLTALLSGQYPAGLVSRRSGLRASHFKFIFHPRWAFLLRCILRLLYLRTEICRISGRFSFQPGTGRKKTQRMPNQPAEKRPRN